MSYLNSTSITAGSAAELASTRKEGKYVALALNHTIITITIETIGLIVSKASSFFLQELGHRLSVSTDNPQKSAFLFQRLSVALQLYNAVCIFGMVDVVQDNDSY